MRIESQFKSRQTGYAEMTYVATKECLNKKQGRDVTKAKYLKNFKRK